MTPEQERQQRQSERRNKLHAAIAPAKLYADILRQLNKYYAGQSVKGSPGEFFHTVEQLIDYSAALADAAEAFMVFCRCCADDNEETEQPKPVEAEWRREVVITGIPVVLVASGFRDHAVFGPGVPSTIKAINKIDSKPFVLQNHEIQYWSGVAAEGKRWEGQTLSSQQSEPITVEQCETAIEKADKADWHQGAVIRGVLVFVLGYDFPAADSREYLPEAIVAIRQDNGTEFPLSVEEWENWRKLAGAAWALELCEAKAREQHNKNPVIQSTLLEDQTQFEPCDSAISQMFAAAWHREAIIRDVPVCILADEFTQDRSVGIEFGPEELSAIRQDDGTPFELTAEETDHWIGIAAESKSRDYEPDDVI